VTIVMSDRGIPRSFRQMTEIKLTSEPIRTVFPETQVQTCIVHLVRHALSFVTWEDRRTVMSALKAIYRAKTEEAARRRPEEFAAAWGAGYPSIAASWRRNWEQVMPFFAYPPEVRRVIYTPAPSRA
jgi:putative transposase